MVRCVAMRPACVPHADEDPGQDSKKRPRSIAGQVGRALASYTFRFEHFYFFRMVSVKRRGDKAMAASHAVCMGWLY